VDASASVCATAQPTVKQINTSNMTSFTGFSHFFF
jgi:hypothetical protein